MIFLPPVAEWIRHGNSTSDDMGSIPVGRANYDDAAHGRCGHLLADVHADRSYLNGACGRIGMDEYVTNPKATADVGSNRVATRRIGVLCEIRESQFLPRIKDWISECIVPAGNQSCHRHH